MKSYFGKIILIILGMVFLSGCSMSTQKNTEIIKIQNDTEIKQSDTELKSQNNTELESQNDTEIKTQSNTEVKQNDTEIIETQKNTEKIQNDTEIKTQNNTENTPKIIDKIVDWGFSKAENRKIDTIIIHSSYNAVGKDPHNLEDIIYKEYKPYRVSPHYIISHDGKIYRLVFDENIAYHAGVSKVPDGRTNVNNFSLGIEIINTKSEKPNDAQYEALKNLVVYLKDKYAIKYVLGHSDIAPDRKDDPWNFDWTKL